MKILYVVHRYGEEVVGGAETACRMFAERLVKRGHDVEVLTSCAVSYVDWADFYEPGVSVLDGVRVNRRGVIRPRDPRRFAEIHSEMMENPRLASVQKQLEWLDEMGPIIHDQATSLRSFSQTVDVVVFMTYLYPTTAYGIPVLAGRVPIVIQPTAHDEPPAYVPLYRSAFQGVDAALYLTEEEVRVADRVLGIHVPSVVTGIGIDLEAAPPNSSDVEEFRSRVGLGTDPYLVYVGRVDVFKGVAELMRFFVEFKGRNPSSLKLVLVGEQFMELPDVEDIRHVGFLDEESKAAAISGSVALVQPSPYESFSIVICEAWREKKPVLVQGHSEVLSGQCRRSEGGLPYTGFAEFEACLNRFLADPSLAREFGENGFEYVSENYGWDRVLDNFEKGLVLACKHYSSRKEVGARIT